MFKGRFNFNVDLDIPVADFQWFAVLNCRCLCMFVSMRDLVHTVAIFSTMCDIGNVTVGPEEQTSSPEHAMKLQLD